MKCLESRVITDTFDLFGVKLRFAKRLVLSLMRLVHTYRLAPTAGSNGDQLKF